MREIIGIIILLAGTACVLWAIAGLFKPKLLFFAIPEKRARFHAFLFPLSVTLGLVVLFISVGPTPWWTWVICGSIWLGIESYRFELSPKGEGYRKKREKDLIQKVFDSSKEMELKKAKEQAKLAREDTMNDYGEYRPPRGGWASEWKKCLKVFFGRHLSKEEEARCRELFGGDQQCLYNFKMFLSRAKDGNTCIYAPIDDHYRPRYILLAETCVLDRGKDITGIERLTALGMSELRSLADALGLPKVQSKKTYIENITNIGNQKILENWDVTGLDEDDLFLVYPEAMRCMVIFED